MPNNIRVFVASVPLLGPFLRKAYRRFLGRTWGGFERSDQYWEDRYRTGGTSGSGSYGRLAQFKAEFLNEFVENRGISSVVGLGCGDGAQLELADYPSYIGFDVAKTSIDMCRRKFSGHSNYEFHLVDSDRFNNLEPVDLVLSLDVIFHLIEDEVFDSYMRKLFSASNRYVVIYAYDFEWTYASPHELGRSFTPWIEQNALGWNLIQRVPNRYPYDANDRDNSSQSEFFVFEYKGES